MSPKRTSLRSFAACLAFVLVTVTSPAVADEQDSADEESAKKGFWSRFKDPEDGKFDVTAGGSDEGTQGLLPLVIPFNEPAIGAGLVAALAYFHPIQPLPEGVERDKSAPPTMSFGGAAVSENGTWAGALGHLHVFNNGRVRYMGVLGYADVFLDFYGIGRQEELNDNPIPFNSKGFGTSQSVTYRVADTRMFVGGSYSFVRVDTTFDVEQDLQVDDGEADNAGLSVFLEYDSRDTIFTPNRGTRAKIAVTGHSEALGGDFDYTRFDLGGIHYLPLAKERLILGMRLDYNQAGDESPFWALPFVRLRGVPAFRYLGRYVVTAEVEPRWKIDTRWSVLAFLGAGRAAQELDRLGDAEKAYGYGVGFRYLLARKLGLGAGIDIARGPEETTFYIIFGSAWIF
jgi:hypothetical protein